MNNEQLKQKIALLTDQRKLAESFLLPVFTGLILAVINPGFLGNFLYICLTIVGVIICIVIVLIISKINSEIKSLINQLT